MFYRWGSFAYRHRVLTPLVLVVGLLALFIFSGTKLGDRLDQEGWDDPGSDSTAAAVLEEETFGRDNSGDVIVMVTVRPDELFQRDGYDVWVTIPITFSQAVLGDKITVPTIDGKVEYDLPEGTQSGR